MWETAENVKENSLKNVLVRIEKNVSENWRRIRYLRLESASNATTMLTFVNAPGRPRTVGVRGLGND